MLQRRPFLAIHQNAFLWLQLPSTSVCTDSSECHVNAAFLELVSQSELFFFCLLCCTSARAKFSAVPRYWKTEHLFISVIVVL